MNKITDILAHIPAEIRTEVEQCANRFGAVRTTLNKIRGLREPKLAQHADTYAPRWRWKVIHFELLDDENRLLNVAERLVVAVRIESARKTGVFPVNFDKIEDAHSR